MKNENQEYLDGLRHTAAHVLAAAVRVLWPGAQNAIGPAVESGFYQDFDMGTIVVTEEDLPKIEQKMREIVKNWESFEEKHVDRHVAEAEFSWNPYKMELIHDILERGEDLKFQISGGFIDLCKGGHSEHPSRELQAFKLLSVAGAYWKGNEKNKMLTRIYGTAFPTKDELKSYLAMLEEAKKRDHRKIGKQMDLFTFSDLVGKGLPLFTPKGTILREELNNFSQGLRLKQGFQKVWIPHITKNDLYKTSGHWDKFGDELFLVQSQETSDQMVLKPMNCPHHTQIYASRPRSYKELPLKYLETTTIYRDEKAGELLGLSRVRSVTQDDTHVFCRPDQIREIFASLVGISQEFYSTLGMDLKARLSYRDAKNPELYFGEDELWEQAQATIKEMAVQNNLNFYEANGEAAFYGPKIDFMVLDAIGREWQIATIQLDFVQPKRFGLTYVDHDGSEQTPVMIHYALMGSIERFLSVYIEHTAGHFPLWLSPVQVAILPVSDKFNDLAEAINIQLKEHSVRSEVDDESKTLPAKIRQWTLQKAPYMCIIGEKESQKSNPESHDSHDLFVSIRTREGADQGMINLYEFIQRLKNDIENKQL